MSANRSVQAAQRRRAGPPEPQAPGRSGPQPSINSSQMFASQPRSGSNIPSARLAQQQQVPQQVPQQGTNGGITSVNKMTVAQAITLITLRLGALETKMLENGGNVPTRAEGQENAMYIDTDLIESIMERLDSLEKRPVTTSSNTTSTTAVTANHPDILLLKQQFETVKQSVIQSKGISSTIVRENKDLRSDLDTLKQELNETKELLAALQNLTMDNSQKILSFSFQTNVEFSENILEDPEQEENPEQDTSAIDFGENAFNVEKDQIIDNEIVGTNLKELIENEINESQ
jgi:hypothetical protein